MSELVKQTGSELAYTGDQIELIKRTICNGATADELALFLGQCKRTGLDALSRQIHAVFRNANEDGQWVKKMAIQVGIDGFRLIADRTGQTDGQDGPSWCDNSGKWSDVWLSKEPPAAARIVVFRKGQARGYTGIATYSEYCQTNKQGVPTGMWKKMPATMLAKCAEALALRKAFPQELSGLYSPEEMSQADNGNLHAEAEPVVVTQTPAIAAATVKPDRELVTSLKQSLSECTNLDELKTIGGLIATEFTAGKLTQAGRDHLAATYKTLSETLKPAVVVTDEIPL